MLLICKTLCLECIGVVRREPFQMLGMKRRGDGLWRTWQSCGISATRKLSSQQGVNL